MKYIWEAADIQAGRFFRNLSTQECWVIGYMPRADQGDRIFITSLRGGLIEEYATPTCLAETLTADGCAPLNPPQFK